MIFLCIGCAPFVIAGGADGGVGNGQRGEQGVLLSWMPDPYGPERAVGVATTESQVTRGHQDEVAGQRPSRRCRGGIDRGGDPLVDAQVGIRGADGEHESVAADFRAATGFDDGLDRGHCQFQRAGHRQRADRLSME